MTGQPVELCPGVGAEKELAAFLLATLAKVTLAIGLLSLGVGQRMAPLPLHRNDRYTVMDR